MKFLQFLLFFISISVCGQSFTEKYNDYLERYEYYDGYTLVGYKKYNEYFDRWEYTDLTKNEEENAPRKSPYSHLEPVQTFDATSVYQALEAKQERYDYNVSKIRQKINEIYAQFENFNSETKRKAASEMMSEIIDEFDRNKRGKVDFSNSEVTNNVLNYFTDNYIEIVKKVNSLPEEEQIRNTKIALAEIDKIKNFILFAKEKWKGESKEVIQELERFYNIIDISDKIENGETKMHNPKKAEEFIKWLKDYHQKVVSFVGELEKLRRYSESSPVEINPVETGRLFGGYRATKIYEYDLNKSTGEWEVTFEKEIPSEIHIDERGLAFKRGTNKWLVTRWIYSGYNHEKQVYDYFDEHGQKIVFDKDLKTITWLSDREMGAWTKMYRYTILTQDFSVYPIFDSEE